MLLLLRSLLWTVLLPCMVAGYVPWRFFGVASVQPNLANPLHLLGILLIAGGTALLATCIVDFARRGRGTLAPVDPPTTLVVQGLYRYVRNPMYLAVATIVLGELLLAPSPALLLYWLAFITAANGFVLLYEEPALRKRFGESYVHYQRQVGRWLPRRPRP